MDLLNRKRALMSVCLIGAVLLGADEDQSDETTQRSETKTETVLAPSSPQTSVKDDAAVEPVQSQKQSSQSSELKPLILRERIRAHANIDLPQDI